MPAALRPDVGDVATPHLIGMLGREFAVQPIRDIRLLNRGLFVGVRARLLADQAQLTHQPTHSETADGHALFAQHAQDAAAAGRAPTLAEQLVDLATQRHAASIDTPPSKTVDVVARPRHIES